MKKLKLVISDLHVHTGALLPDGTRNVNEEFLEDELLVEFLEHFSGGDYERAEVELIVNGDFFNLLEIEQDGQATESITEAAAAAHLRRVIDGHAEMFDALRDFVRREKKHLVFTVGNHDAALLFPDLQKILRERLGKPVPIEISRSFDGVFVTHGHQYEFVHNFDMRDFTRRGPDGAEQLKLPYGSLFVIQFLRAMKARRPYIDKVKPFEKYMRWAFWNDHLFFWRVLLGMVRFWVVNRVAGDEFRRREFRLSPSRLLGAMTHRPLVTTAGDILRQTRYHVVIFGHSHKFDYRRFGDHGEYFNTGTWTEVISLDVGKLGRSYLRPYVRIDYDDGKPRASLHNWIGSHRLTHRLIS